ncbi:uncharacterized protein FFFS_15786 [Fusarium fujikuroi]|nr:uncharacterized protein FFFS_15786 [Fusarium fujikuroi]
MSIYEAMPATINIPVDAAPQTAARPKHDPKPNSCDSDIFVNAFCSSRTESFRPSSYRVILVGTNSKASVAHLLIYLVGNSHIGARQVSRFCSASSEATGSTQGLKPVDQPRYHVETFPIPAPLSEFDLDYRRTMTIESQQRPWPQDIWVHSPHGLQLYQPVLMFATAPEEKQETNGSASKSG